MAAARQEERDQRLENILTGLATAVGTNANALTQLTALQLANANSQATFGTQLHV